MGKDKSVAMKYKKKSQPGWGVWDPPDDRPGRFNWNVHLDSAAGGLGALGEEAELLLFFSE